MTMATIVEGIRGFSIHLENRVYPPTPRAHEIAAQLEILAPDFIAWQWLRDPADEDVQQEIATIVQAVGMYRARLKHLREPLRDARTTPPAALASL